jgi:hypothetical protein
VSRQLGPDHDPTLQLLLCCRWLPLAGDAAVAALPRPEVYLATIVVLVSIMRHGASPKRVQRMNEAVGVDRRTVERWRRWWRDNFTATPFWQIARAAFMPPVEHECLPGSLLERFSGDAADRLIAMLRFLGPITGGRSHAR